jgi:[acyl-carrier-protein] S-malonyltransferase
MAIAWVFPGQGSQKPGMADAVLDLPGARQRFQRASELIGRDLLAVYAARDQATGQAGVVETSDLNDTRNSQSALFVIESLLVDGLHQQGRSAQLVAGHSLGELVALYAAGVFDADTGLKLVHRRSELMAAAGSGAMTAVMGFNRDALERAVSATDGVVIANDNSASQVVLSGTPEAVASISATVRCKRAIPLAVSGAFHSPFMSGAAEAFGAVLEAVPFADAGIPVLSNAEPLPETSGAVLKARLMLQMTQRVRWRETMEQLMLAGTTTAVEIGPGNVLSGLIKRSCPDIGTAQIAGGADLGL